MKRALDTIVTALDKVAYLVYSRLFFLIACLVALFVVAWLSSIQLVDCAPECVGSNFMSRDLSGSDFSNNNLVEVNFRFANLNGANLYRADLSGANLAGANLQNADLRQTKFLGADLTGADLRNTLLEDTDFRGADLSGADLTRTYMVSARLEGALFEQTKLVEVDLRRANLAAIGFVRADLTGANLTEADLSGSSLSAANLSGANLRQVNLSGAWANLTNFTGADISEATLAGTRLLGANLTSVDFTGSNLTGVTLIGAKLNGANLLEADLTGSRLFLAELQPTDLTSDPVLLELNELQESQIVQNVDLGGVTFNDLTRWPRGKLTPLAILLGPRFDVSFAQTQSLTQSDKALLSEVDMGSIRLPPVDPATVKGDIRVVGSSTVAPLTEAIGAIFINSGYSGTLRIETTGTSHGFDLFCAGEADIVEASRPITEEELAACAQNERVPLSFEVGFDALTIVVNPVNDFVDDVSLEQLLPLFTQNRWADINPEWSSQQIVRFMPEIGSGTLDTAIGMIGVETPQQVLQAPNTEFLNTSETVLGLISNPSSLGVLSYAYYQQNTDTLKLLTVDGILPDKETVAEGHYPLKRSLFLYTTAKVIEEKPQVGSFMSFYLTYVNTVIDDVGYFPQTTKDMDRLEYRLMGLLGYGL